MGEIDCFIEQLGQPKEDLDDLVRPLTEGPSVTQIGDLWILGKHRVLCGSAIEETSYQRLMDGAKAAMVITDPPYNVPIDGHASGLGKTHGAQSPVPRRVPMQPELATLFSRIASAINGATRKEILPDLIARAKAELCRLAEPCHR